MVQENRSNRSTRHSDLRDSQRRRERIDDLIAIDCHSAAIRHLHDAFADRSNESYIEDLEDSIIDDYIHLENDRLHRQHAEQLLDDIASRGRNARGRLAHSLASYSQLDEIGHHSNASAAALAEYGLALYDKVSDHET